MHNYIILTNNPAVRDSYPSAARYLEGDADAVLEKVRDAVHQGAVLISHPLAGSLKPHQNPYRSVLLSRARGEIDLKSLAVIEDALAAYRKFEPKARIVNQDVLRDFMVIDMDLVCSALGSLPAWYF